jgi:dienelactone hydrolase
MSQSMVFSSNNRSLTAELFVPQSSAPWPGVVVAYGTEGMNPPFDAVIEKFATGLADQGILAAIPDYFAATGTRHGDKLAIFSPESPPGRFDIWAGVLQDAVRRLAARDDVEANRTGLVGFSLGGHLVLKAAAPSSVKAVVDFFGPVIQLSLLGSPITSGAASQLPPVQIHHGDKDVIVPIQESRTLDDWLTQHSVSHEFHVYRNEGHPGQPGSGWSNQAQQTSLSRTTQFLLAHL